jgi:hypothetical protein
MDETPVEPVVSKKSLLFHPEDSLSGVMKEVLKTEIDAGKIGTIDASTEEGHNILTELNAPTVPQCVEKKDGKYVLCKLDDLLR